MCSSDLLPSLQENFGIAVLEAVQAGCAVAISDQVYLADYFGPGSAVFDLHLATWIEFFSGRMGDDLRRERTATEDRLRLDAHLSSEEVNRNWAEALHQLFDRADNLSVPEE